MKQPKRVVVNGYTYETFFRVKVGTRVLLPTVYWLRDVKGLTWEGTVSSLTSDYTGRCESIIAVLPKRKSKKIA